MTSKKKGTGGPKTHKVFGPSKSRRWMNCSLSVSLSKEVKTKPQTSIYAAEGVAAHELAETCLRSGETASSYLGYVFNKFTVDEEMADAVQVYLDRVNGDFEKAPGGAELHVEYSNKEAIIHPDFGGTADSLLVEDDVILRAYDYKHGKGLDVSAVENSQAMCYLLEYAAVHRFKFPRYEVVIVQPRLRGSETPVKSWTFSRKRLKSFHLEVLQAIELAGSDQATAVSGDWCRYCPAGGICPRLQTDSLNAAMVDFSDKPDKKGRCLKVPNLSTLSASQIGKIVQSSTLVKDWLKRVEEEALSRLSLGEKVPGLKLVKRKSNRKWSEGAESELLARGVPPEDLFDKPSMKSPAKLEALYEGIEDLWIKPEAGVTCACLSDKRASVSPPIEEDFLD